MVLQHDLNPASPSGIHYYNKLDPGKRLARWALAPNTAATSRSPGRSTPATRPRGTRCASSSPSGGRRRADGRQQGDGGGRQAVLRSYVEPARPTPGEALRHFRLAGADGVWHAAEARIDGQAVVAPRGGKRARRRADAYSAAPIGANLYNEAGLPATPFAAFAGEPVFQAAAAAGSRPAATPSRMCSGDAVPPAGAAAARPPVPVGFARPGVEVTVEFAGQTKRATAGAFGWRVDLDPMPASAVGRDLVVRCGDGAAKTVEDLWVGDSVLTGPRSWRATSCRRRGTRSRRSRWCVSSASRPRRGGSGRRASDAWRSAAAATSRCGRGCRSIASARRSRRPATPSRGRCSARACRWGW